MRRRRPRPTATTARVLTALALVAALPSHADQVAPNPLLAGMRAVRLVQEASIAPQDAPRRCGLDPALVQAAAIAGLRGPDLRVLPLRPDGMAEAEYDALPQLVLDWTLLLDRGTCAFSLRAVLLAPVEPTRLRATGLAVAAGQVQAWTESIAVLKTPTESSAPARTLVEAIGRRLARDVARAAAMPPPAAPAR